jgi:FMN phosphatase YigB (HAD superfamily)
VLYQCVVLDFDGTFTDVEVEARPFFDCYRADFADLIGQPIDEEWSSCETEVRANPDRYGWQDGGRIVAPANADPYIRTSCTAQLVLDRRGLLLNPEARTSILQSLFQRAYALTRAAFRPDAADTLLGLKALGVRTFFVTNARPDAVRAKLERLMPGVLNHVEVFGDAQKFVVAPPLEPDSRFDALPDRKQLPGLARPLYLRRGRYFDALRRIWSLTGATPSTTLVCGDIYELDLAMPAELGAAVQLVSRPDTPAYERDALTSLGPRAALADTLLPLLDRLNAH